LKKELPGNTKVGRIEQAVETILNLQGNLRSYIDDSPLQNETIDLKELLLKRSAFFAANHPKIDFQHHLDSVKVHANTDALIRILDNLLSNAAKYNKKGGSVEIILNSADKELLIKDTGRGIKNPHKIFQRFYKEHDRGLGIGLHIVKKLCDALHIPIDVDSEVGVGSTFTLKLDKIISSK
jgi:signal transduction histidine kinase